MEAVIVAKSEKPDKPKGKPGPKPDPVRARTAATLIRSMPDWKATLEELAEYDRATTVGDLIDRAIVAYARSIQFPKQFPKR